MKGQRSQIGELGVYAVATDKTIKDVYLESESQSWSVGLKIVFVLRYRVSPLIPRLRGNDRV